MEAHAGMVRPIPSPELAGLTPGRPEGMGRSAQGLALRIGLPFIFLTCLSAAWGRPSGAPATGNRAPYIPSYLSEGLKINALLTVPLGEKPAGGWPVIIFNHGFIPPDEYRTTERYVAYVDSLARHGYIVLRSDYRGHADSEGEALGAYGPPG